jgi:hypothetical protein
MEQIIISIGIPILACLAIWITLASYGKAKRLIHEWAKSNGYSIIYMKQRFFRKGPFWLSSLGQIVYYVNVKTSAGPGNVYIRCGSFWGGMRSDNMEIEWEGKS